MKKTSSTNPVPSRVIAGLLGYKFKAVGKSFLFLPPKTELSASYVSTPLNEIHLSVSSVASKPCRNSFFERKPMVVGVAPLE